MIYIDSATHRLGRMKMSHMTADTLEELPRCADALGLRRDWFQGPPKHRHAHFDLCQARRKCLLASDQDVEVVNSRELAIRAQYLALEIKGGRQEDVEAAIERGDTEIRWPPRGVFCFHCGQTFMTPRTAQAHFGEAPDGGSACLTAAMDSRS
jgi:hypothetical protein